MKRKSILKIFLFRTLYSVYIFVRNSQGEIMVALSSTIFLETLAARRAVLFVRELGFRSSIFQGDSEVSINALRQNSFLNSSFGHIVKDTLSLVSSLRSFSFTHTYRQGNALTHALDQRARLSFLVLVWMEFVPPYIHNCYVFDLLSLNL